MAVQPRVFALDVDGEYTLAFESINIREALELCKEARLRANLTLQTSNGIPLCGPKSKFSVRLAEAEEAVIFGRAEEAKPPTIWCWRIWLNWILTDSAMTGGKAAAVLMDARRHANPAAPPEPLQLLGFMHAEGTPW